MVKKIEIIVLSLKCFFVLFRCIESELFINLLKFSMVVFE